MTFDITARNDGPSTATITSLTDDRFGDLTLLGDCNTLLGSLPGLASAPANVKSCTFMRMVMPPHTNIATVSGTAGRVDVVANDDASVTTMPAAPALGARSVLGPSWGLLALLALLAGVGAVMASRRGDLGR